ncbi:leucine-rich repeat-containing protein 75A [Chiroxiphia lanceolata]|uniref:leucine-rich repeat-containing protein 75A n=1 Tax=Neopelma chrysocephalum TaxID=114329 RepID=UPI000FCD240E|nr:leucine-rich repeat-containing protein 75A [Neopelma chrysocephalum]XP_027546903.1 leucine-rich repeat-containing protein 75A [Neopelma chrysocephalum]XP_032563662.1 leucine-rich repeat-containing protein 75A [Chiroxiphia lanceolata]XP_032563663.1 leucine-rich repeat-containing protein 75A [Chiroxiphia lanceolata]
MGTKQTKGCQPGSAGESSPAHHRKKVPPRERGDFLASLVVKSGEKFGKGGGSSLPPYHRRICMIQDMLVLVKQGKQEEATELLKNLRQDLGMESTSLDDVLYRYASFRNLVDPITHDLIISLARYIHCPKPEGDSLGAMEKLCRQLTYHLSPHSQWRRQGIMKRKPQSCLKAVLMGKPQDNTVDLSGIPLTLKDLERVTSYLQHSSEHIDTVELCFTELTDDMLLQLLPALCGLPHLTTLSLNGNRLTKAILRDLTETLKDPKKFPSVTWIDLGNNVDIFSLPQPFLVSLKRRCPKQGNLPTILEFGEGQVSDLEGQDGLAESQEDLRAAPGKTDSTDLQQTDRTAEAGELPNSERGAGTPQT